LSECKGNLYINSPSFNFYALSFESHQQICTGAFQIVKSEIQQCGSDCIMDVHVDVPNELPPDIEPPTVSLVLSLEVVDDPKVEDPTPPPHHYHRNLIFP